MHEDEIAYDYHTASIIIHKNRCHLVGILVNPKLSKRSYVDVHDGENTTQEKVFRLRANTGCANEIVFPDHILMRRGLYVYLHDDAESFTVFWHTLPD